MQPVPDPALTDSPRTLGLMPKKVPPSSAFGRRLTELRLARGLTQTQLAELIDSTQRCISRYETVAEFPPAATVIDLAQALKVSADELLGLRTPRPPQAQDDPETRRLWKKFQQVATLPEKDRRAVIRL
jgi:transcriptional regulator with XRE-family HTH domain